MDVVLESLGREWQNILRLAPRALAALAILAVFFLIGKLVGRGVERAVQRGKLTRTHTTFFRNLAAWGITLFGLMIAFNVMGWQVAATGLLAGGSVTAIVLGFAFRGIGENLLAGVFLAFGRPFDVGDVIRSGEFEGAVKGIELRNTHVRTADGQDIYIPNAQIFNSPLVNFTQDGLRRPTFTVGIDYGDDVARARRLMLETVRATEGVLTEPPAEVVIRDLAGSWVELQANFWVDTFKTGINLAPVRTMAMETCRAALLDAGYTLSSNVTTNLNVATPEPVGVRVESV